MFEFAIVGIPIAVIGIIYITLIGTKLLGRNELDNAPKMASFRYRVLKVYQLEKKLFKFTIPSGSEFTDSTIAEASLGKRYGVEVVQISRKKGYRNQFLNAQANLMIKAGDILFVEGSSEDMQKLAEEHSLTIEISTEDDVECLQVRGIK